MIRSVSERNRAGITARFLWEMGAYALTSSSAGTRADSYDPACFRIARSLFFS